MALIAMAVFDTVENQRTNYTRRTLYSLSQTVDFTKHRMFIIDNNSCAETKHAIALFKGRIGSWQENNKVTVITLPENIGTAEAINLAWKERTPGEHCIKMDNDVVIASLGWVEELEEAVRRQPRIGQVALKRKDLAESPNADNPSFLSKLMMLPHNPGERWIVFERCSHIMGTVVLHSSSLLDKVGYMQQVGVYGFDDSFMSLRSEVAGFINGFLPHIDIDHIDVGGDAYTEEKRKLADAAWPQVQEIMKEYKSGRRNVYYSPFKEVAQ